jgi:hypothetical protein
MKKNKLLILSFIALFIFSMTTLYKTQKLYGSIKTKFLSEKIALKIETISDKVKTTKKPISIKLGDLTNNRNIDKFCIIYPYHPNINNFIGVNWKQSDNWKKSVVNDDTLFSIFLIEKTNVIPIKLRLSKLRPEKTICIINKNDINLNFYYKEQKVILNIK